MNKKESLLYILKHHGHCEGRDKCHECHYNNGKEDTGSILDSWLYCTFWGDVRVMDLARHEALAWPARVEAAQKLLRRL